MNSGIKLLRSLAAVERTRESNTILATILAFVAGAANAGGFLATHQYTSHMSGIVSTVADNIALTRIAVIAAGVSAVAAFVAGAMVCAIVINWGGRSNLQSKYALPLGLEAVLLTIFGMRGNDLEHHEILSIPVTVALLCFVMGLQNAMITKVSKAEIRTTHVTGMITDIGIELGKLVYVNWSKSEHAVQPVVADRTKIGVLTTLVLSFFVGGVSGAFGFRQIGFQFAFPLASMLLVAAAIPIWDDFMGRRQRRR